MKTFEEAFDELAPANQNNSREIVRGWIRKFRWSKGEFWSRKIEAVLGWDVDWSDKDYGEPPVINKLED
jgi:hypothetical protein